MQLKVDCLTLALEQEEMSDSLTNHLANGLASKSDEVGLLNFLSLCFQKRTSWTIAGQMLCRIADALQVDVDCPAELWCDADALPRVGK